jgi:hypothetical protein
MGKTARGVCRNGQIELLDEPEGIEKARVIVTFLDDAKEVPQKTRELLAQKRGEILEIAAKYHVENIRVFGSAAGGEMEPGSNIDFLVKMQSDWSPFDLTRLKRELQQTLGCPVDVIREAALPPSAREQACREAAPV